MSLGDPSPSPERDPQHSKHGPPRPKLEVRTLDPLAIRIDLEHFDRFVDILDLCGITPSDSASQYLWKSLLQNQIPSADAFNDAQGALGLNTELVMSSKHELECRGNKVPELCEYDDKVSVTLSSRHREGSELASLRNLSAESPGLHGLQVEIIATPIGDSPAVAHIFWHEEGLSEVTPDERRELLRGFYYHFNNRDLPETVSLTSGQAEKFHYLSVELDPMVVKVQRLHQGSPTGDQNLVAKQKSHYQPNPLNLRLINPPLDILAEILSCGGALHIQGDWVDGTMTQTVLSHLSETLDTMSKLDIDVLKMCENALPCISFTREEVSDGAHFPPRISSKISMMDYTSRSGDLFMEIVSVRDSHQIEVFLKWDNSPNKLTEKAWEHIHRIAKPFLAHPKS